MGRDKALIEIDGVPLLLRVAAVAQQVAEAVYVVTAWTERYRDLCKQAQIQLIPEPLESMPPGAICGFLRGLTQVQADWLLLLACDLPNLRAEVLQTWRMQLAEVPPDVMAVLPQSEGGWEPLCGFYRSQCQASLQAFVDAGGRSFQTWLNQQSVQVLSAHAPAMLLNCNTPADLQQVQRPDSRPDSAK
jgi:molybdopterin-guanine dinucleotide biosynthesis protein A